MHEMMESAKGFLAGGAIVLVILGVIGLIGGAFWIWMFIDAIRFEKEKKVLWIVLLIFLGIIAAIIYYFVRKRKRGHITIPPIPPVPPTPAPPQ